MNSVDSVEISMFSHRFHRSAQMLGCVGSPTESTDLTELLAECILPQISQIYTEVRLSSSAPSEVSRFCEFCAICGRTAVCLVCALETSAPPKIASVQSVGVTLLRRRQDTSATIFRTQRICVDLCNLWEALLSSRFCGFCAICGRTAACSVGALETSAPPKNASVPSVGGSPQQQVL